MALYLGNVKIASIGQDPAVFLSHDEYIALAEQGRLDERTLYMTTGETDEQELPNTQQSNPSLMQASSRLMAAAPAARPDAHVPDYSRQALAGSAVFAAENQIAELDILPSNNCILKIEVRTQGLPEYAQFEVFPSDAPENYMAIERAPDSAGIPMADGITLFALRFQPSAKAGQTVHVKCELGDGASGGQLLVYAIPCV